MRWICYPHSPEQLLAHEHEVEEGGQCVSKRNAPSTHSGVDDQVVPSSTECMHAPIGNHSAGFDLPGSAIEIPHSLKIS